MTVIICIPCKHTTIQSTSAAAYLGDPVSSVRDGHVVGDGAVVLSVGDTNSLPRQSELSPVSIRMNGAHQDGWRGHQ